ncbi:hypothetical protein BC829DRAFT_454881 [Chytridium lagenaria]|nr:hypothetical protein BC829DRAFT_454881 [Chytridium lagenaria]
MTSFRLILLIFAAIAFTSVEAAINRLCIRRCYSQSLTSAPPPCTPAIDFSNHESRDSFLCACSVPFIEASTQCAISQRCSDTNSVSEIVSTIQDHCSHLGEHWNEDGTLISDVDKATTSATALPSTSAPRATAGPGATNVQTLITSSAVTSATASAPAASTTTSRSSAGSLKFSLIAGMMAVFPVVFCLI